MGNVLLFCNGIESGSDPDFFYPWQNELAKGFENCNYNVHWINFSDQNLMHVLNQAITHKIDFAFAFNWVYSNVLMLKTNDNDNLLNKLNIPIVNMFMDPVFSPNNRVIRFTGINHALASCISEDEPNDAKMLAPHVNQAFYCPLGGNIRGGGYLLYMKENIIYRLLAVIIILTAMKCFKICLMKQQQFAMT